MNNYSNATHYLPNELVFFKQITFNKSDPIKRYMFNLKEINYIIKRIYKFSVPSKEFFERYYSNNKDDFMNLLCKHYVELNVDVNKEYEYIKKFISIFYDYTNPRYNNDSDNILWIYPRISVKNFIKESIFENKTKNVYFDKNTLNKLISIFTNFTKYEYSNCNDNISFLFEGLNYPSLILANIDLYEKGYIEIVEDTNQTKLFLNKKTKIKENLTFSENRELLKTSILDFINLKENTNYSLNDFL